MQLSNRESDVLSACLQYLALLGLTCWRSNNTGVYDAKRGCYRAFRGARGMADILGVLPQSVETGGVRQTIGVFLAVEVKRPGGKLSADQEQFLAEVTRSGGLALCVRSVDELQRLLEPHLAGPGRRQEGSTGKPGLAG